MFLYLSIIFIALFIVIVFNVLVSSNIFLVDIKTILLAILISFGFELIINIIIPLSVNIFPKKWLKDSNKLFDVTNKERKFYEKIKIRNWKDKIWDLGWLGGFSKSKVCDPHDMSYIERFIFESKKGIMDHTLRLIIGFCVIFIYPKFMWVIGFPIAIVNLILNSMSLMVVRYNLPKLKIAFCRLQKQNSLMEDANGSN